MKNPFINEPDHKTLALISNKQAWHYRIVPSEFKDGALYVFIEKDADFNSIASELEIVIDKNIKIQEELEKSRIESLLEKYYTLEKDDSRLQKSYFSGDPDTFLDKIILEAKSLGSSDIHMEIYEQQCRIRMRVDGQLIQRYLLEKNAYPSLVNKIKITSNLDIAEKRLPQDGRIFYSHSQGKFDIRVSILPTLHGEKIVLRLLNNEAVNIEISSLGFSETDLENYLEGIKKPNGIVLISGPTGSGKTTTLYATLKLLNKSSRNILTIEDPIEYTLEGINQVQLKESIGLTFSNALRTFLRQDPDIIMLGEIRDSETANMAIRAALTGHLVLSTIHTNSALGTISRLIDMGVAPYLIANTLNTSVAQRLIRMLCPECKKHEPFNEKLYPKKFKPNKKVLMHYIPTGCAACFNTGYKSRKAVYEVIPVDEKLHEQIKISATNHADWYRQLGIKTLSENAFELFSSGETSLEEIYSILVN